MVSIFTIIALLISGLVSIVFPILVVVIVKRKSKHAWGPFFAGVLSFWLLQIIIRIPLLQVVLPNYKWYHDLAENYLLLGLFLGGTAALFETVGRLFTMKFLLRNRVSYHSGILHGAGHGGIEAILLVGLNFIIYAFFATQINSIGIEAFVVKISGGNELALEQTRVLADQLVNQESWMFLVAGLERAMTIVVHIALSLMIMEGIYKNRIVLYSLIVFLIHGSLDFFAVYLQGLGVEVIYIELLVLVYALLGISYILTAKKRFGDAVISEIENKEYIESLEY